MAVVDRFLVAAAIVVAGIVWTRGRSNSNPTPLSLAARADCRSSPFVNSSGNADDEDFARWDDR